MKRETRQNEVTAIKVIGKFFGSKLSFRVKMLNMLSITGILGGLVMGAVNTYNTGGIIDMLIGFGVAVFCLGILISVSLTGHYKIACILTILIIFMGYFPYLFFSMGGFHGAKNINFVFAIVFTAYILGGKLGLFMIILQILFFIGIHIHAYNNPASISPMPSELNLMLDTLISTLFISLAISIVFVLHLRMYNRQQRKLDEQNLLLSRVNMSKTQFLANASHEMRTPLTIISVTVQNAIDVLKDKNMADSKTVKMLSDTQGEVMRLSRMVSGMLSLSSVSEVIDKRKLDISEVLGSLSDMLNIYVQERENALKVKTDKDLLVFYDADLFYQVIFNLIKNSCNHTANDVITLKAERVENIITITISDNGTGISSDLLPHIFERGITDGKGTGYGLYLCKMIVESHGGKIWVESNQGKGTSVYFTLPDYEGQL